MKRGQRLAWKMDWTWPLLGLFGSKVISAFAKTFFVSSLEFACVFVEQITHTHTLLTDLI